LQTLDYPTTSAPRPVSSDRARSIGVLSLDPTPYAKTPALLGIQRATRDLDYLVSIVSVPSPTRRALRVAVERLRQVAVAGILVVAPQRAAIDTLADLSADIPLVVVGSGPQEILPAVAIDHYSGAAAATRHLLELGHRTVFHIAGPADRKDPGPRFAGWRDTLVTAGVDIPLPMVGDWSADVGYELGRRLAVRREVTAVFAANDQMALGVLRALSEAGRRVPDDVSVVGFEGIPQGEFFSPPLTTVRQNFAEMGRRSLDLLLSEIEAGRHARIDETIPAELIIRASTAAAP
jgi:DNA-binding LacI/PurR family transcriptional regulator